MGLFDFIKRKPKGLPNIPVYYLKTITEGDAKTIPLGVVPKFSDDFETSMREKHRPDDVSYFADSIGGDDTIFRWQDNGIVAISFLSAVKAQQTFPGLVKFTDEDLVALDATLTHFPR